MLVARRDPFHAGAHDALLSQRPELTKGGVPRVARAVTMLQIIGSLLAIPVGLVSAYSIYRANFSVETTCEGLRANIISMIAKNVDAGTLRMLVRRDVERFAQTCGTVDPDAKAAFKALLAADRPATPVAAAIARSPEAPPKEAAHQTEPLPGEATKQPAAKANPVVTASPERGDAAVSDGLWLDAVRQALQTHRAAPPTADAANAPVAPAPAAAPVPRSAQQEAALPVPAPAVAAPEPLTTAPALPPASTVATPAMPPVDDDHPLPPASIPESVPPPNADVAKPGPQGHSRIGKWFAQVPLLSTVIGIGRR
jgi:hypothetical protein